MRSFSLPASTVAIAALLSGGALLAQTPAKPAAKPATAATASTDPVVITVGTETIRASQLNEIIKGASPDQQAAMIANKREVATELGKMMALAQEAHRLGLDQDAAFRTAMMMDRDNALAKAMVDKLQTTAKPSDAAIQAYYASHTADFAQTQVKHILIGDNETQGSGITRTPAEALAKANQIEAQLKAGGNFATLAKANSDDPGSKDKGGELGQITPGQTVPEFDAAIKTLPVGQVSAPVHTQYGYHIIEVEARTTMPLAQATPLIQDQLLGDSVNSQIDKVSAAAHVVLNDAYFGPAKPTPPTTPHP